MHLFLLIVKKTILAAVLILSVSAIFAQEKDLMDFRRSSILKMNLLSPVASAGSFWFEKTVGPYTSFDTGVFVSGEGWGVTGAYRFYLSDSFAPNGTFFSPFVRIFEFYDLMVGGGILLGTQTVYREKIAIGAYFGPSLNSTIGYNDYFGGFGISAGIQIGIKL